MTDGVCVLGIGRCECRRTWDRDCRSWRTDEGFEWNHPATTGHMNICAYPAVETHC